MAEVGTKLIFENEQVRVWEFTLEPGESIGAHKHEYEYFFYPIEGGTLEVTRASGVTRAQQRPDQVARTIGLCLRGTARRASGLERTGQ